MNAKIYETGRGLAVRVGDYAYDDAAAAVYRVTRVTGAVHTRRWEPSWIAVTVERWPQGPDRLSDDEFARAWAMTSPRHAAMETASERAEDAW